MRRETGSAVRAAREVAATHIITRAKDTAIARRGPRRVFPDERLSQLAGRVRRPSTRVTRMMVSTRTWVIARSGAPRSAKIAAAP